jgi:hypothetical protein
MVFVRTYTTGGVIVGIVLALLITIWASADGSVSARLTLGAANSAPTHFADALAAPQQQAAALCQQVSDIPISECEALVALYKATAGPEWLTSTNWLMVSDTVSPCDWYGVSCANGQVTALDLTGNRLTGSLPAALGALSGLTSLMLDSNRLTGPVPPALCALAETRTSASLAYNSLSVVRRTTRACLERLDPDWASTQTVPPRNVQISAFAETSLLLGWTPIFYTADGGFYEVSYATTPDGPFTTHGQTADKTADSYRLDGLAPGQTYFIHVRTVTPAHDSHPDELVSGPARLIAVTASEQNVLLMVYFPADNDLSSYADGIARRLRDGTALNPNVQVVMLSDQENDGDTRLLTISGGQIQQTDVVRDQWGTDELDTADPVVLAWFVQYARSTYPAEREIISLMGHGVALAPEISAFTSSSADISLAATPAGLPPLPKGMDATPGDVTNGAYMSLIDMGQALDTATNNGTNPVDLLFFDQCFQGNLDTLYEVRGAAEIFIASPNYAWLAAPYHQYLALFAPAVSNAAMADAILERYQAQLNDRHPNVIFWVRSTDIEAIASAVNTLGDALQRAVRDDAASGIVSAVRNAQYVDTNQCGPQQFALQPPDELIGADTFAANMQRAFPADDRFGVSAAAGELLTALDQVRSSSRVGRPHIAPREVWEYEDTITILAPLPRDVSPAVAWRTSIYTSTMPLTATWSPVPTQTVVLSSSFAYVRDGTWDDFLGTWYTTPLTPTVGQWCRYIPPAFVTSEISETLALTLTTVNDAAVQLDWNPTEHEEATGYDLYVQDPYDLGWTLEAVLPPEQTSTLVEGLEPDGTYRYIVVGRDADEVVVAQSNDVQWPAATPGRQLFLPLIQR